MPRWFDDFFPDNVNFQSSNNNASTPGPTWAYWLLCSSGERQYATPSDNIDFIARMRVWKLTFSEKKLQISGAYFLILPARPGAHFSICPSLRWNIGNYFLLFYLNFQVIMNDINICSWFYCFQVAFALREFLSWPLISSFYQCTPPPYPIYPYQRNKRLTFWFSWEMLRF